MGGKTKQSQRTKNNARPSSSGRSAELLSSVKLESGIVNVAGTQLPALFPSLVGPSVDPLITPELQLCLKKLTKKDPITKTKALQELTELVITSKVEDVVAALPSWAHFYTILTADPDRKVRECTQACHGSIVSVCGRRVAPHLKQLMPAWLSAQSDDHAPAQTHAQRSLAKTFPDNKLPEVLSFCKDEVVAHLVDVLTGNGELAHIKKNECAEEREAGVTRAVCRSLHALQYLVRHLPPPLSPWLGAALRPLLGAPTFWQRAVQPEPRIRAAWFGAVGSIVSRFKAEFGAQYGVKTLRVLVGSRESNPQAAAQLWDCLLLFMHHVPDWHQHLEKKELLSKRILDVLESGGWGDAKHLSNMLLPMFASLPEEMLTKDFYVAFFNAMFNGLDNKSIFSSKSERQFWITSLEECLRYLSTQPQEYVAEVVTAVHRTWLEKLLSEPPPAGLPARNHLIKFSATSMASLLKYWLKQGNNEKHDPLIRNFWQNVGSTLVTQIDSLSLDQHDIERVMDGHILLLKTFKSTFTQQLKKQRSIKFEVDTEITQENCPTETQPIDPVVVERYNHNLNELAQSICSQYLEFASKKQISGPVLSPLITLLVEFDSGSLFAGIARQLECESVYRLYDTVLRTWLTGDTMRCAAVVDVLFMLMKHLTEQEQDAMFDTFQQFRPSVVEWCIALSLSHPHRSALPARRWLRGEVVAATVRAVCSRLLRRGDAGARRLLLMCLDADANGESMVSAACVRAALEQVSASLHEVDAAALEVRSGVAAQLAASLPADVGAPLLAALLALTTTLQPGDGRLSAAAWRAAHAAWQDGARALPAPARQAFLRDAAAMLHAQLHLHSNLAINPPQKPDSSAKSKDSWWSADMSRIEHIVSLCPALLASPAEVRRFTTTMFDVALPCPTLLHSYATRHLILTEKLNCPFEENDVMNGIINERLTEVSKDELVAHVNTYVFRATYLRTMLLHRPDEQARSWCDDLLRDEYLAAELVACVHDYAVVGALCEGYAFWPHFKLIEQSKKRLETLLEDIINETNSENKNKILNLLTDLTKSKGYFWAYARRYYDDQIKLNSRQSDKTSSQSDKSSGQIEVDSCQVELENNQDKVKSSQVKLKSIQGETEIIQSETEISQGETEISQGETEIIQSETEIIQNETENSQGETKISQDETEIIQSETENSQGETEISQGETEIKQSVTEIRQCETEVSQGETDNKVTKSGESLESKEVKKSFEKYIGKSVLDSLVDVITGPALLHTLHYIQANTTSDPADVLSTKYYLALADLYLAHCDEPPVRDALLRDVTRQPALCPDVIINLYYTHNHTMLYEMDVSGAPWRQVLSNSSICSFLAHYMPRLGWSADNHHWDFANITLCSLLTSVELSKRNWGTTKVSLLGCAVLRLFSSVRPFVAGVPAHCQRSAPSAHVAALPREWDDIYAPDLNNNLFSIVLHVLECSSSTAVNSNHVALLDALVAGAAHMQWDSLSAAHRAGRYCLKRIVDVCTATLKEPVHSAFKYLAYSVLKMMLKPLVLEDAEKLSAWSLAAEEGEGEGEGGVPLHLTLLYYDDAFFHLQEIVETAVAHVRVCEEVCSMVPFSDSHSLALGWLLLAELLHQQCALARGDLTHQYIQIYREQKYTEPLLRTALRLLPAAVLAQAARGEAGEVREAGEAACADMFTAEPQPDVYKRCGSDAVRRGACRGVWACVRGAGAGAARSWRGAAHHRHAQLLDNITRRYITPHVIKEEFALIQKKGSEIEDTEITINWSMYEVSCVLRVDESPIELVVSLARQHPLVLPRLTAQHHAAGNINWILMYLGYQNGTILNALKMWTVSVNNKMERAPQCYICYCRLHHATGRLPTVHCHTCKNKYHNVCLRKWFLTSSKMTCPLCRANF